jgi:hypothetical protein
MLVMTGIDPVLSDNPHIFRSADRKAAVWAGAIDDLWKMGRPSGKGGPWLNAPVRAGIASDPYLFGGYGLRSLNLSHTSATTVNFRLQLDATGDGVWFDYRSIQVPLSKSINFNFQYVSLCGPSCRCLFGILLCPQRGWTASTAGLTALRKRREGIPLFYACELFAERFCASA